MSWLIVSHPLLFLFRRDNGDQDQGLAVDPNGNITPALQVVTWLLVVVNILAVTVRLFITRRSFSWDDGLIAASGLMSILQTASISLANAHGYGRLVSSLSPADLANAQQAFYAASLCTIVTITLAKLSVVAFVHILTPRRAERRAAHAIGALVILWALSSLVAVALACPLPHPWDWTQDRCVNQPAFWIAYCGMNILTDAALVGLPLWIVLGIQASWSKRCWVGMYFAFRIFPIAATSALVYFISTPHPDPTFSTWPEMMATQVVISASLISSVLIQYKRVFDALDSGMLFVHDPRRQDASLGLWNSSNTVTNNNNNNNRAGDTDVETGTGTGSWSKAGELRVEVRSDIYVVLEDIRPR